MRSQKENKKQIQVSTGKIQLNKSFIIHHSRRPQLTTDELVKSVYDLLPAEAKKTTCYIAVRQYKNYYTEMQWFRSDVPGDYFPPVVEVLKWASTGNRKFKIIRTCLHADEFLKQFEDWFIKEFETGCRYCDVVMEDYIALHQGSFVSYNRIHFFNTESSVRKMIEHNFYMKYPSAI